MLNQDQIQQVVGSTAYSSDGDKIGKVGDVYLDDETGQPEWATVNTGLLSSESFVPLSEASFSGDQLTVPYTKDKVKDAPSVGGSDGHLSPDEERELYAYYGLSESMPRRISGTYDTADEALGREASVTRSEEQLRVGKREVEAGRVRLRKWVETESVSEDVTLRRETARVTREPVNEPVSGQQLGEQEIEVELRAEEPVVEKQVVARERIGLEKDVDLDTETVSEQVRKERVDVEGDVDRK